MKKFDDHERSIQNPPVEAAESNAILSSQPQPPISGRSISSHPLHSIEQMNENDSHESCSSCLWTGVLTCVGLSAYFAHAAYEIPTTIISDKRQSNTIVDKFFPWLMKQQQQHHHPPSRYNKPVFLMISAGWLCVGAYRWHLG